MAENGEIFAGRVGPDLYRTNAFRITQIFVDATDSEIRRKANKIKLAQKYAKDNLAFSGFFQLKPDPTSDSVQEALERLRDPEKRLIEEFFWFWPVRIGQSAKDPALAFLKKRELQSAVNVWKAEEKRSNDHGVSKHNLAVIAHMTALDQEHRYKKKKVHEDASQKLAQFWRHAFKRWSILINEEAFWSRLAERVREFNDPRLTRGTVERIRESLPPALLSINVSLAVSSAEHDRLSEAQRQKSIVASSGFNSSVADQALVRGAQPSRDRLRLLLQNAKTDSESDKEHADGVCRRLLGETAPILKVVDLLLPAGNPTREAVHDDIAQQVLASQIEFGNSTHNWKVSLELLELVAPVAEGAATTQRITENIEILRNNLEGDTCWYCQKNQGDPDLAIEFKMYGDLQAQGPSWRSGTFRVPRCQACAKSHEKSKNVCEMSSAEVQEAQEASQKTWGKAKRHILVGGLVFAGSLLFTYRAWEVNSVLGAMAFLFIGLAGGVFAVRAVTKALVASSAYHSAKKADDALQAQQETYSARAKEWPTIKDLIAKGWKYGPEPTYDDFGAIGIAEVNGLLALLMNRSQPGSSTGTLSPGRNVTEAGHEQHLKNAQLFLEKKLHGLAIPLLQQVPASSPSYERSRCLLAVAHFVRAVERTNQHSWVTARQDMEECIKLLPNEDDRHVVEKQLATILMSQAVMLVNSLQSFPGIPIGREALPTLVEAQELLTKAFTLDPLNDDVSRNFQQVTDICIKLTS